MCAPTGTARLMMRRQVAPSMEDGKGKERVHGSPASSSAPRSTRGSPLVIHSLPTPITIIALLLPLLNLSFFLHRFRSFTPVTHSFPFAHLRSLEPFRSQ